ncbi:caspase family protein [Sulfurovum sp. bin170]|uniref:caspase family protein n=1 Tax=Sulfurovum sp. bin170 TaxID=2695268 RepID=UPI0013DF3FFB|nr:caspase family protein [Sulfurovum sp. bin170]NEW61126.1 caspase family protein [Sulfurovum sp. bin170]
MKYFIFLLVSLLPFYLYADENRAVKIQATGSVEQRVALVIGNSDYRGVLSKLSNPINDAKSIKNILEQRGFKVIYSEDTTKKSMKSSLNQFYTAIKKGGVGMFYFSGHGIEVDGQNYLIPVDAKIEAKSDTEFEAIALNKITKRMQNIGNRLNIVVLDACRNDPFSRSIGTGGLAKVEPIGMFVSYSTGAGSVASDGRAGGHGLFTESLIKYMGQELDLRDVFQKTRKDVYTQSNKKQFPAIYDQTINGGFYFTTPTASSKMTNYVEPVVAPPQPREERVRHTPARTQQREEPIDISPYPIHNIPPKRTHVAEEEPEKYYHPPEDYRSVVGYD